MPRRPILLALAIALLTTGAILLLVRAAQPGTPADVRAAVGQPAPAIKGTTLDGTAFDIAAFAGKPVVVNFWGPSCVPCRDEFPLLAAKLAEHAPDGLTVVGVLTDDPVEPARDFVRSTGRAGRPSSIPTRRCARRTASPAGRRRTSSIGRACCARSRSARCATPTSSASTRRSRDERRRPAGRRRRTGQALRTTNRPRRRVAGGPCRRAGRPARPQRRGQDDDGRDRRGLPAGGWRTRPGARGGSGHRWPGASGARRPDAPGRRDRPAGGAARDPAPVRPLPRRAT